MAMEDDLSLAKHYAFLRGSLFLPWMLIFRWVFRSL